MTAQSGMSAAVHYHNFSIPADLAATAGPLDQFGQMADGRVALLRRHAGLISARYIVDFGCGFGLDAIPLIGDLPLDAKYLGLDENKASISWANDNITGRASNFCFHHLEPQEDGAPDPKTPVADNSQDLIFAFSFFTRAYPDDAQPLLREFARALRPGGIVFLSAYVIRPGLIRHLGSKGSSASEDLTFVHQVDRGFYLNDPNIPAGPVGFSPRKIGSMSRRARLVPVKFIKGGWANDGPSEAEGPDAVVLAKPVF